MPTLLYKVIKGKAQYRNYQRRLSELRKLTEKDPHELDEQELLELLVGHYEQEQDTFYETDPVQLLRELMRQHNMKAVDLARMLQVSEGLVSDMLHYKKGFSRNTVRRLAQRFQLAQEAFNRPYTIRGIRSVSGRQVQPHK